MEGKLADTIYQEEQLDISIERVEKINSPLLVVGLGGTGADTVRTIKRVLAERYVLHTNTQGRPLPLPPRTAYLVFDTDTTSSVGFDANEYEDISLPHVQTLLSPEGRSYNLSDAEQKWVNKHLNAASAGFGAGTYRQAARFMMGRQYSNIYAKIRGALTNIVTVQQGAQGKPSGRLEIVLITGICGGTGSGTFLDIAQIIRHCMKIEPGLNQTKYQITGYIFMPDISLGVVPTEHPLRDIFQANGFAALKELDFWMRAEEHKTPYSAEYGGISISWSDAPPFDACVLLSGSSVNGTVYANAYEVVQTTIAENLLHYLADEIVGEDKEGRPQYTYISYEDNLRAAVRALTKRFPLFYGYRAIGAYIKRIPKKKILYYEGKKLFETFIPPRNDYGHLVPNSALLKDGKSHTRAERIAQNIQELYTNFRQLCALPPPCTMDNDRLRDMNPAPHDRADAKPNYWRTSSVLPAVENVTNTYLEGAWQRFSDFAIRVMTNPEHGPFALEAYLQNRSDGLLAALEELQNQWSVYDANFSRNVGTKFELAKTAWPDFKKPPFLGRGAAEKNYRNALNEYYDAVRKSEFVTAHAEALAKLVKRVKEYIRDGLSPLCEDLLRLEKRFDQASGGTNDFASDIFDLASVTERIDNSFAHSNADQSISRQFLGELGVASLETRVNVDDSTSGVAFQYRFGGMDTVLLKMRDSLNKCFGAINGETLDQVMLQTVGEDTNAQTQYLDRLGNSVINSATPLFSQDGSFTDEKKAQYSYLSVPDDAAMHIQRYEQAFRGNGVEPKGSKLHDHIYCITAWDGLPLYRYSQMKSLERIYHNIIIDSTKSMGIHLVWDGERDSEYMSNWTKLPSPRPYYFFQRHGTPNEEDAHQKCNALVERARACGMLKVDSSTPLMSMTLRIFHADSLRTIVIPSKNIIDKVDGIRAAKDPATGNPIKPGEACDRIAGYLSAAGEITVRCPQKPFCIAAAMGLEQAPCDPWDQAIIVDQGLLKTAQQNHRLLCEALATALVAGNPKLYLAMKTQLEGFEYAHRVISDFMDEQDAWKPRIQAAEKVASMMIHGILFPSTDGWDFTTMSGTHEPVIQRQLLHDSLEAEELVVKVTAYIGDLRPENPTLYELERLLEDAESQLNARNRSGALTTEDLQKLRKKVEFVRRVCAAETGVYTARRRALGADTQRIDSILALLAEIDRKAVAEDRKYEMLLSTR